MRRKLLGICLIMILSLSACGKKVEQDTVTSGKHTETAAERNPGEAGTVQASPSPAATSAPKTAVTPKAAETSVASSNATATPKATATAAATAAPKATATPKAAATATATPKATAAPTATPVAKETAKATATPAEPKATATPETTNATETSQTTGASESKEQTTASTPAPTEAPHNHTFVDQTVSEATCTEGKVVESVCSVCGASNGTRTEGGALGHDLYEDWFITPDCTNSGWVTDRCRNCGYADSHSGTPLGHDWEEDATVGQNCRLSGTTTQICRRCGVTGDSWENGQYGDHVIDTWEVSERNFETGELVTETVTECTLCGQSF